MAEKTQAKKPNKIATYFRELKAEFKRISWPTFKLVKNNTAIVIAFIVILGAFIALVDFIFNWLLTLLP
jgi:preprotein translocase subunit SecE